MYVPDKFNLKRFQVVELPTNRDIFKRIGNREPRPTPPELEESDVIDFSRNKLNQQVLFDAQMAEYDAFMQQEALRKQGSVEESDAS